MRWSDENYAIFHKDKLLSDSIPEKWLERELCVRYGFCGREFRDIVNGLKESDSYRIVL